MKRRLVAILAADVVGYSRLMSEDEQGTLDTLKAHRNELIYPTIAKHEGRLVKLMGDGVLVEFPSVVAAVQCAVDIQRGMAQRKTAETDRHGSEWRIGINIGDVIVEGEDIYGDGVNVAVRLEGLCEPGAVILSDDAYRQVKNRLEITWLDGGEHEVKNIARPIQVWHWTLTGQRMATAPARGEKKRLSAARKPSIAVLPFDNLSDDPEQEYFVDGIVDDIITALSKFRWFFVIARSSSFAFKGTSVSVAQVARDLGVQYVLEGSVRRVDNRIRINAQLIDALTGIHLWAERYDRELNNIFDVQDEMTATIVGAIAPELGDEERLRAKQRAPENLGAWDQYQRGLWHYWRREKADTKEAENLFLSAVKLDPGFSSAHAGLSEVCYSKLLHGWTEAPEETLRVGLRAAQKAVSLDDKDAFAHFALGRLRLFQGQLENAIAELRQALDLNPNLAVAYYGLGIALLWSGRAREALPLGAKAIRQSPKDPLLFAFEELLSAAHFQLGEYVEAAKWGRRASGHPTSSFWTHLHMAAALIELDETGSARAALKEAMRKQPDLSLTNISVLLQQMHPDYRQRILDALRQTGLKG